MRNRGSRGGAICILTALIATALAVPAYAAPDAPVITAPIDGVVVCNSGATTAQVTVAGTAPVAPEVTVRVYDAAELDPIATDVPVQGDGSWSVDVVLAHGEHILHATAYDAGTTEESTESTQVTLEIDAAERVTAVSVAPTVFSPKNRDGTKDTATVSATFASAGTVKLQILRGSEVVKTGLVETIAGAAQRSWTWSGKGSTAFNGGDLVPSRTYTARALWMRDGCPDQVLTIDVTVDNRKPSIDRVKRSPKTFFPKENDDLIEFKDTVTATYVGLSEPANVKLRVHREGKRRPVRTIKGGFDANGGRGSVVWNGRKGNGDLLPEGRYELGFRFRDRVGNVRVAERVTVRLSHKRIDARTTTLTKWGDQLVWWGTNSDCGDVWRLSDYARGAYFDLWDCDFDDTEIVAAQWNFTAPRAKAYGAVTLAAYGHSDEVNHLFGFVRDFSGGRWRSVGREGWGEKLHWFKPIGNGRAVNSSRKVKVQLAIGDEWTINDYDIAYVRVKVRYGVLVR